MLYRLMQFLVLSLLFFNTCFAKTHGHPGNRTIPQPIACITPQLTNTGGPWWYNVQLKLTNNCGQDVDFQSSNITFINGDSLNTNFWGNFSPLSYPDNPLQITSTSTGDGRYIASMYLHFPTQFSNTILHNGQSFTLLWGSATVAYDPNSVKVYVNGGPVQTGEIDLTNSTAQPSSLSQTYAQVDLSFNGQVINTFNVPWSGQIAIPNLATGTYTVIPKSLTDSQGNTYQGQATPTTLNVTSGQKISSTISYTKVVTTGSINVKTPALPTQLSGYTQNPTIIATRTDIGSSTTISFPWNTTNAINNLENNITYSFSTPKINYNGNLCTGSFVPTSLASSAQNPPTTQLSYTCSTVPLDKITLQVQGLPTSASSITLTFTPTDGSTPITKTVAISAGSGTDTVNLTDGMTYSVSSTNVPSYSALFNPQPLVAKTGVVETVSYQAQSGSRIIAYMPGWKTPPVAADIANAGYTNVLVAFGVFSTTQPGAITSAFDTVTADYINTLHQAGLKVSLSLGGASTSIANTSVDFHQVLSMASSPDTFQQTFVTSIQNLMTQYGFDGVDFDIEHGLNGGGTFTNPTGDIAVLANIINTLHANNPNMLISLAPQTANVAATAGFDQTWGNYASLVMQTYNSLSWVGVQIYNTGCVYGLNMVCYADDAQNPDLSVAIAADLLENWPKTDPLGRQTGFQPYISYLKPNQIVLGYPAPNASGASDGAPVKPTSVIKRAFQCLRTGVIGTNSCNTYVAPHLYPNIGGVFEWEITYDQNNNYLFAKDLKSCVLSGSC